MAGGRACGKGSARCSAYTALHYGNAGGLGGAHLAKCTGAWDFGASPAQDSPAAASRARNVGAAHSGPQGAMPYGAHLGHVACQSQPCRAVMHSQCCWFALQNILLCTNASA